MMSTTLGELGHAERRADPLGEIPGPAPQPGAGLDHVEIDRARVHRRQPRAELAQRVGARPEGHLDDVRLLEVERLAELDARDRGEPQQVIVDDRGQLLAQVLEARELERVDDGEPLGQHLIPHLGGHP
ncbi:MAG: hypothetical protein DME02_13855 [Candidatus Rokuibacteriota bacterium]|nr:MAG: hypothetical protein DME02_13855 [Candidatus Rokubacteria bacterium]